MSPAPQNRAPRNDSARHAALDALRRRIAGLERFSGAGGGPADLPALPLGAAEIDDHLPWGGLPRGGLHEITYVADSGGPAAAGFAAALLGRLARAENRAVVWCRRPARGFRPNLYGAGLAHVGLDPERLVLAQAANSQAVLWAMEECLRSRAVTAVLGEPERADLRARRRLQLAAEETGVTAFLLLDDRATAVPGPAVTRWQVAGAPGRSATAWRVALLKCRGGGRPGAWTLEWRHNDDDDDDRDNTGGDRDTHGEPAGGFRVVSPLRHGPATGRAAG